MRYNNTAQKDIKNLSNEQLTDEQSTFNTLPPSLPSLVYTRNNRKQH